MCLHGTNDFHSISWRLTKKRGEDHHYLLQIGWWIVDR
jgi:hypothetical protein